MRTDCWSCQEGRLECCKEILDVGLVVRDEAELETGSEGYVLRMQQKNRAHGGFNNNQTRLKD